MPRTRVRFSGAVLAGGASTRMGRDKALIVVDERPLVSIAVSALVDAGATEVFVVGGNSDAFTKMGLRYVPDEFPGEGPLGGILSALNAATEDIVAILACDHVHTEGPAVTSVVGALGTSDVAIAVVDGRQQTLHAAWRRSARTQLRKHFDEGARSVRAGIVGLEIVQLLDGDPCWFQDADVPGDLTNG